MINTYQKHIDYLEKQLLKCIEEYRKIVSNERTAMNNSGPFALYCSDFERIEFFARITYGIIISTKVGSNIGTAFFNKVLIEGTNPDSTLYWGELETPDQRLVELVPITLMLYINRGKTWDTYTEKQRQLICKWFSKINSIQLTKNNWIFFYIIPLKILRALDKSFIIRREEEMFAIIENQYLGRGWYSDGYDGDVDYYNAWAFHFYSLLYSVIVDDKKSEIYKKRAIEFAEEFQYWFSDDGKAIPFGRSLTYRMAQSAFFSAMIYARCNIDESALCQYRDIVLQNIDWWLDQPIQRDNGLWSVGYTYPNTILSDEYNAYGSPYWGFKAFFIYLVDRNDELWSLVNNSYSALQSRYDSKTTNAIYFRNITGHSLMFVNRDSVGFEPDHYPEKYKKYCYSNVFGFSISKGNRLLRQGAFDSTTVVEVESNLFVQRGNTNNSVNNKGQMHSEWSPVSFISFHTVIIPGLPWHVRIQKIVIKKKATIYECGFSIPGTAQCVYKDGNSIYMEEDNLVSGIKIYDNQGRVRFVKNDPSTNVLFPKTLMPYAEWTLTPGRYIIITACLGANNYAEAHENSPEVQIEKSKVRIRMDKEEHIIDFGSLRLPKLPIHTRIEKRLLHTIYHLKKKIIDNK